MRRGSSAGLLLAALVVTLIAVGLGGARLRADTETVAARCERFAADAATHEARTAAPDADILVIGDSWSVGLGLPEPADAWPSRLPGRVRVAGFSGSGYGDRSSPCGAVSFADRARAAAAGLPAGATVVVEGGLNDWDRTDAEIVAGFRRLLAVLGDRPVVVLGPPAAPARAAFMGRVRSLLADLSRRAGVRYVPTEEWQVVYQPDGLHPTDAGARAFGDAVADAVRALG